MLKKDKCDEKGFFCFLIPQDYLHILTVHYSRSVRQRLFWLWFSVSVCFGPSFVFSESCSSVCTLSHTHTRLTSVSGECFPLLHIVKTTAKFLI